jgi:hypothetical protein
MIEVIVLVVISLVALSVSVLCGGLCLCGICTCIYRGFRCIFRNSKGVCAAVLVFLIFCVVFFAAAMISYYVVRSSLGLNGPRAHVIATLATGTTHRWSAPDANHSSLSISLPLAIVHPEPFPTHKTPLIRAHKTEILPEVCRAQDEWTCSPEDRRFMFYNESLVQ